MTEAGFGEKRQNVLQFQPSDLTGLVMPYYLGSNFLWKFQLMFPHADDFPAQFAQFLARIMIWLYPCYTISNRALGKLAENAKRILF